MPNRVLGLLRLPIHCIRPEPVHRLLRGRAVPLWIELLFLLSRHILVRRHGLVLLLVQRGHLLGLRRLELH
jgi:hypothetical protein